MIPLVTQVRHIHDYRLQLTFTNGVTGELDFKTKVVGRGGVFKALENLEFFRQVRVDPEVGTIVWPNDVDFDPDALYSEATGAPLPIPQTF